MFINRIMNFLKVFLGCLLAVVAGSILTFLFWILVLLCLIPSYYKLQSTLLGYSFLG